MLIKKLFNPYSPVGGLEISDLAIRFLSLEDMKIKQSAVSLAPGVISRGQIINRAELLSALRDLHLQISGKKKIIPVVLVLPPANVYAESFTMPFVPEKEIPRTAELNLKMIAPSDIKLLYHSYEIIGQTRQGQYEALAAFANSQVVDSYVKVLEDAGFGVLRVEFPALAVSRLIKEYGIGLVPERPYLTIYLGGEGLDLMIIKNGNIYFNYFHSWMSIQDEIGGRKLSAKDIEEFLSRQIKQIVNYHSSRSGKPFNHTLVIQSPISQEIMKIIRENFSLEVQLLTIGKYTQVSPLWYGVLGAVLKNGAINLAPPNLKNFYDTDAVLNFIKYWRNAIAGVLGFALLVFLITASYLARKSVFIAEKSFDESLASIEEIKALEESAQKFNRAVDLVAKAQELSTDWSPLLEKIASLAGQRVTIEKFSVGQDLSALLNGRAVSDSAVIAFKNAVEKEPNFKDVVLPLSNITVNKDETVSFTLQFKVASLEF